MRYLLKRNIIAKFLFFDNSVACGNKKYPFLFGCATEGGS